MTVGAQAGAESGTQVCEAVGHLYWCASLTHASLPMPPHCRKKRRAQKSRQVTALYSQALNEHRFLFLFYILMRSTYISRLPVLFSVEASPSAPHSLRHPLTRTEHPQPSTSTSADTFVNRHCVCVWGGGIPEQPGGLLKGLSQLGYAGHSGVRSGVWDDPRPSGGQEEGSGVLRFAVLDSMCMVSYISQAKEM